jgi:hypothetical protein
MCCNAFATMAIDTRLSSKEMRVPCDRHDTVAAVSAAATVAKILKEFNRLLINGARCCEQRLHAA